MKQLVFVIQIALALLLVISILVQQKGTGLGNTFGGDLSFYRTKRGAEKLLFYATIILTVFFIASTLIGFAIG